MEDDSTADSTPRPTPRGSNPAIPSQRKKRANSRNLTNVYEMYVLTNGINRLHAMLVASLPLEDDEKITEVPHRLMSWRFLQRLLKSEVMLKSCQGNELSGAQRDLMHLSLEQLLCIRRSTLDFSTESATHNAHCNFIRTVEMHLFAKLAQRCLRGDASSESTTQLYSLGLDICMVLGVSVLGQDIPKREDNPQEEKPSPLVPHWGFKLDPSEWPDQVAIFHTSELWVEVFYRGHSDFSTVARGNEICIICDRTMGVGKHRMFDCDLIVLNPCKDDIVSEMSRVDKQAHSKLNKEMEEAMYKRKLSMTALDSSAELFSEAPIGTLVVRESVPKARVSVVDRINQTERLITPVKPQKPKWKMELEESQSVEKLPLTPLPIGQEPAKNARDAPANDEDENGADLQVFHGTKETKDDRNGCGFCCASALFVVQYEDWTVGEHRWALDKRAVTGDDGILGYVSAFFCCASRSSVPP